MPSNIHFYPYNSPIILTDTLFLQYGGETGSSSATQRNAAYFLAEWEISSYLKTFLKPTNVTGTFQFHPTHPVVSNYTFVNSINSVIVYSRDGNSSCTLTSASACSYLRNAERGIFDISLGSSCGCGVSDPYQIEVGYTAGLPSGTVYNSAIMWALSLLANEELEGLLGTSANPGGVGIIKWSNQEYSEEIGKLQNTPFGSTTISQKIMRLLSSFVKRVHVGL